jgi:hypothetical protein
MSTVALAVAGLLIALDRFLGCSTAWMRYMATQQDIQKALAEFQIDWDAEKAGWPVSGPSPDQVKHGLAMCKAFMTQINTLVQQETNAWIAEFKTVLQVVEDEAKAKREIPALGAVNLTVENGDQSTGGWTLTVNDGEARSCTGKAVTVPRLEPRIHTFRVAGTIHGIPAAGETSARVGAGEVVEVKLKLV